MTAAGSRRQGLLMPRSNTSSDDDIVFEDLHGASDDESGGLEVDLDAKDDDGITRRPRTSSEDGDSTGDDDHDDINYGAPDRGRADDDDDDDGDDSSDRFSKKFEARLKREQRTKRRERDRADNAERENARLRKQLKANKRADNDNDGRELDRQIESTEADLEQALEGGDSKTQVRLTSQLTDLKAEKIAAKYTTNDDDDDDDLDDTRGGGPTRTDAQEMADDWKDDQSDWYGRRGFERQTRMANRIDKEVFNDGYRPDEEDYYEELDRRLKEKMPDLFTDDGGPAPRDSNRQPRRDKGRSPVASADDASRDSKPRQSDGNKVQLGPDEFANMRRFGLDPRNPAHVKEYALNKRQTDAEEAANG